MHGARFINILTTHPAIQSVSMSLSQRI